MRERQGSEEKLLHGHPQILQTEEASLQQVHRSFKCLPGQVPAMPSYDATSPSKNFPFPHLASTPVNLGVVFTGTGEYRMR